MNCNDARERLLEAEPAELAGRGESELAAHLRTCARCAGAAARLLEGQALLDARLAAFRPRASVDQLLERLPLAAGRVEAAVAGASGRTSPSRRRLRAAAAVPLAAAAVVAILVFRREPPPRPLPVAEPSAGTVPAVRVPAGRDAAIFRTANPKITIVWIY
ncbi:MAG TPA: hypothetical protein VF188_17355 [Longimicrobiales bacterium]